MRVFIFVLLIAGLLLMTDHAFAFRCGNEVVTSGDSLTSLQAKCGSPTDKIFSVEKVDGKWESVQRWSYNCGESDFIYVLTIIHGKIKEEKTVGRGAGPSQCQGR